MIVKNVRKLGKYISKLLAKIRVTNGNTKNISKNGIIVCIMDPFISYFISILLILNKYRFACSHNKPV